MLKEIAKVLLGVLIAGIFFFVWLISENMFPVQLFGLKIGLSESIAAVLTDFTFAILLVYYAWIRKPKQKEGKQYIHSSQESQGS